MKMPTPAELDGLIVDAGFGGDLVLTTFVAVRDVYQDGDDFKDWLCVRDVREIGWPWVMVPCRTLPTPNELSTNRRNKKGTAIITAGHLNRRSLSRGYHNPKTYGTQRPCMRQVANIRVHRDDNGDLMPDWSRYSETHDDAQGVNIHDFRGSSAGCITLDSQARVDALLDVVRAHGADRWDLLVIEPLLTCES